jgi:hypothetical protein
MDQVPSILTDVLERDERLIWWDRPKRGLVLRAADAYLIPFSVVWSSMALFAAFAGFAKGKLFPDMLITSIFGVAGIHLLFGRFLQDAWRRGRLVYGLTSKRVLIVAPSRLTSIDLEQLGEMQLQGKRSGTGSIVFGRDRGVLAKFRHGHLDRSPGCADFREDQ